MTAIKKWKQWFALLSVFALGGMNYSYVQSVEAKKVSLAEVERACERALRANTIEALEDFLHKYPPRQYRNEVACYALALGAIKNFGPQGNTRNDDRDPGSPGGYGG